jgi:hypothetical protein
MKSISHAFGEALRFACTRNKRGFQTKVGNLTSIDKANFCHILKGAGSSEEKRRAILAVVLDLDPTFPARTYDEFLSMGQWSLDHDNDPTGWQPQPIQGVDKNVLTQSIEIVEELISENKNVVNVSTGKKAVLIAAMYENITSEIEFEKKGKSPSFINTLKLFLKSLL